LSCFLLQIHQNVRKNHVSSDFSEHFFTQAQQSASRKHGTDWASCGSIAKTPDEMPQKLRMKYHKNSEWVVGLK